jgi:hypothetical protein
VLTTPISFELNDALGSAEESILLTGADPKEMLDAIQADFEPKFKEAMGQ